MNPMGLDHLLRMKACGKHTDNMEGIEIHGLGVEPSSMIALFYALIPQIAIDIPIRQNFSEYAGGFGRDDFLGGE